MFVLLVPRLSYNKDMYMYLYFVENINTVCVCGIPTSFLLQKSQLMCTRI